LVPLPEFLCFEEIEGVYFLFSTRFPVKKGAKKRPRFWGVEETPTAASLGAVVGSAGA